MIDIFKMSRLKQVFVLSLVSIAFMITSCSSKFDLQNNIGVCTDLNRAMMINPNSTGCSYVEIGVASILIPESSDEEFQKNLNLIDSLKIPVKTANGFFPGDIKLVGPEVNIDRIRKYVTVAMQRAQRVGIKRIVLGSGRSRYIADGYDRDSCRRQFVEICKAIAEIAGQYDVVVVIEPLNPGETNFINTTLEGAEIAREVNHPNMMLLADFYHMARSGEDPYANIVSVKDVLRHCHIAENTQRTAPGVEKDDFTPYFKALRDISYDGLISIECGMPDVKESLTNAIAYMKEQISASEK